MFLLALQRPHGAVFLRLTRRDRVLPPYEALPAGEVPGQPLHRLEYSWLPHTMACQDSVPVAEDGDLFILHGLRFSGDTVFTNHLPVLFEELSVIRAAYEEEGEEDAAFHLKILGGRWTKEHIGISADRVAVLARGEAAKIWCGTFQWPRMTSFSFSKYTEAGAVELAREVLRRGNYFFRQWLYSEETDYKYTDSVLAGYQEDLEWVTWMTAQDTESVEFGRAMAVRRMLPKAVK